MKNLSLQDRLRRGGGEAVDELLEQELLGQSSKHKYENKIQKKNKYETKIQIWDTLCKVRASKGERCRVSFAVWATTWTGERRVSRSGGENVLKIDENYLAKNSRLDQRIQGLFCY